MSETDSRKDRRVFAAFDHFERFAHGGIGEVAVRVRDRTAIGQSASVLVFDCTSGKQIDVDPTAPVEAIIASVEARTRRRGRPKMGVDCGEICLLPRHWEWLRAQPRSASATIRRLIDAARKGETPDDRMRERVDAAHAFLWALAGDLPDFEEATRALFAREWYELERRTAEWPADVRSQMHELLGRADNPA